MTDLDKQSEKSKRRFNFAAIAFVVTLLATSIAVGSAAVTIQRSNTDQAARDANRVEQDYQTCLRANESRAGLRESVNREADKTIAEANDTLASITDPSIIPDADAPQFAAWLRFAIRSSQNTRKAKAEETKAEAETYRARQLARYSPRDCDAEKKAAAG